MKTLDEVIAELEDARVQVETGTGYWIDYRDNDDLKADALQWLKGYKGHIELDKLRDKCEAENEPLTWDELRTMEGKPVWVVPEAEKGYWFVIEFFNNNPYYGGDRVCFTNDVMLNRCDLGKTWQAYRKER